MLRGRADVIGRDSIAGWVADYDDPDRIVEILVCIDGVERGRYPADRPRLDLLALRIYGAGNHGFEIELIPPLSANEDHEILVRPVIGHGVLERGYCRILKHLAGEKAIVVIKDQVPLGRPAQAGPRYVIHIGPHKTGTTYLQRAFSESHSELLAGGVFYPGDSFGWTAPGAAGHTELHRNLATEKTKDLAAKFAELNASQYETIIISSEDLIGLPRVGLHLLKSLLEEHPVDIVFYCRRWSDLLPSVWQETVKQGGTHGFEEFIAGTLTDPVQSNLINFDMLLRNYIDVFGIDRIRLISYSNLADRNIDIYDHFVYSLLKWTKAPSVTRDRPNQSMEACDVEIVRALNSFAAMDGVRPGDQIFHRYWRRRHDFDTSILRVAMHECRASIHLNDAAAGLRTIHDNLFEEFHGCLVEPLSGFNLFQPAIRELPFIQSKYLLADGVVQSLVCIYREVSERGVSPC